MVLSSGKGQGHGSLEFCNFHPSDSSDFTILLAYPDSIIRRPSTVCHEEIRQLLFTFFYFFGHVLIFMISYSSRAG